LVAEAELHLTVLEHKPQLLEVLVAVELGKKDHLLVMVRQELLVKALLVETILVMETSKVVAEAVALVLLVVMLVQH
jgi:hypothetical protein